MRFRKLSTRAENGKVSNEQMLKELWDDIKRNNIRVIRAPESQEETHYKKATDSFPTN